MHKNTFAQNTIKFAVPKQSRTKSELTQFGIASNAKKYTEAGKAIGFAFEQPLHVVVLPCSAWRIFSVYFKTASA
ncbi:MAG: hypothetical protein LBK06_05455 [Planctomycetaceae bacterium]|nr:hypothetical protein [Planctomycetaceae bacterium]